MAKSYSSQYYAEKKKEKYIRKELILPKDSTLVQDVEEIMGPLSLTFNSYMVRALTEQIKRDREFIANMGEEWQIVSDELEMPRGRGNRYRNGYVFKNRSSAATEAVVASFYTEAEATGYIESQGLKSTVTNLTPRMALVKEYALMKRIKDKRTGKITESSEPLWISDIGADEA